MKDGEIKIKIDDTKHCDVPTSGVSC